MKLILLTLVLNLVGIASYATMEINCTNGVNLKATHIAIGGGGNPIEEFVVVVVDKNAGRTTQLHEVAGKSTCSVTPKSLLDVECEGGPKLKIYMATFNPLPFGGGGGYSILAKTGIANFSDLGKIVKPSAVSKGFMARCLIY